MKKGGRGEECDTTWLKIQVLPTLVVLLITHSVKQVKLNAKSAPIFFSQRHESGLQSFSCWHRNIQGTAKSWHVANCKSCHRFVAEARIASDCRFVSLAEHFLLCSSWQSKWLWIMRSWFSRLFPSQGYRVKLREARFMAAWAKKRKFEFVEQTSVRCGAHAVIMSSQQLTLIHNAQAHIQMITTSTCKVSRWLQL